jgi:hypothetical protein
LMSKSATADFDAPSRRMATGRSVCGHPSRRAQVRAPQDEVEMTIRDL